MHSDNIEAPPDDAPDLHAEVVSGTARQPRRLVISAADDVDAAQGSGEWIAAAHPAENRR